MINKVARSKVFRWGIVFLYALIIFMVSSMSVPDGTLPAIPNIDKLIHFTEFGILCVLVFWALLAHRKIEYIAGETVNNKNVDNIQPSRRFSFGTIAIISILATSLYAGTDEFHQSFLSFRDSNIFDWLADVAGAHTAGLSCIFIGKSYNKE